MNSKKILRWIPVLLALLLMVGCAGPNPANSVPDSDGDVAGLMTGLWNGFTAIIAIILSIFFDGVTMYEVHNNGGPYNLGFVVGIFFFIGALIWWFFGD